MTISDDRRGSVSGDVIALELRLSATPDAAWIEGFLVEPGAQHAFAGRPVGDLPRIEGDLICWSVRTTELRIAWQHLIRCLERANFRQGRARQAETLSAPPGSGPVRLFAADRARHPSLGPPDVLRPVDTLAAVDTLDRSARLGPPTTAP